MCATEHTALRGLAAPLQRPLRAADLVPGRLYLSPSGRTCMLLQPQDSGLSRTTFLFAYLNRSGRPTRDDGFNLSAGNARAIAALRELCP